MFFHLSDVKNNMVFKSTDNEKCDLPENVEGKLFFEYFSLINSFEIDHAIKNSLSVIKSLLFLYSADFDSFKVKICIGSVFQPFNLINIQSWKN